MAEFWDALFGSPVQDEYVWPVSAWAESTEISMTKNSRNRRYRHQLALPPPPATYSSGASGSCSGGVVNGDTADSRKAPHRQVSMQRDRSFSSDNGGSSVSDGASHNNHVQATRENRILFRPAAQEAKSKSSSKIPSGSKADKGVVWKLQQPWLEIAHDVPYDWIIEVYDTHGAHCGTYPVHSYALLRSDFFQSLFRFRGNATHTQRVDQFGPEVASLIPRPRLPGSQDSNSTLDYSSGYVPGKESSDSSYDRLDEQIEFQPDADEKSTTKRDAKSESIKSESTKSVKSTKSDAKSSRSSSHSRKSSNNSKVSVEETTEDAPPPPDDILLARANSKGFTKSYSSTEKPQALDGKKVTIVTDTEDHVVDPAWLSTSASSEIMRKKSKKVKSSLRSRSRSAQDEEGENNAKTRAASPLCTGPPTPCKLDFHSIVPVSPTNPKAPRTGENTTVLEIPPECVGRPFEIALAHLYTYDSPDNMFTYETASLIVPLLRLSCVELMIPGLCNDLAAAMENMLNLHITQDRINVLLAILIDAEHMFIADRLNRRKIVSTIAEGFCLVKPELLVRVSADVLREILQHDVFGMPNEESVFDTIRFWIKYNEIPADQAKSIWGSSCRFRLMSHESRERVSSEDKKRLGIPMALWNRHIGTILSDSIRIFHPTFWREGFQRDVPLGALWNWHCVFRQKMVSDFDPWVEEKFGEQNMSGT